MPLFTWVVVGDRSSRRAAAEQSTPVTSPILKLPKLDLTPVLAAQGGPQSPCQAVQPLGELPTERQQEEAAEGALSSSGAPGAEPSTASGEASSPMEAQIEQALSKYHSPHLDNSPTAPACSAASAGVPEAAASVSMLNGAEDLLPMNATSPGQEQLPAGQQLLNSASEQTAEVQHAPVTSQGAAPGCGGGEAEGGEHAEGYVADADSPIRGGPQGACHHQLVAADEAATVPEVPEEAMSDPALLASPVEDGNYDDMPDGGKAAGSQAAAQDTGAQPCAALDTGSTAALPLPQAAPSPSLHVLASPARQMSGEDSPMLQVQRLAVCLLLGALLQFNTPSSRAPRMLLTTKRSSWRTC